MPGIIETELGKITIAEDIVATIVGYAAGENYGIVGMSQNRHGRHITASRRDKSQARGQGNIV